MKTPKQYELQDGIIYYIETARRDVRSDTSICITAYEGTAEFLAIPSQIDNKTVTAIAKKAFWGNRYLQHIVLPDTLDFVGSWAFSACYMLRDITLPYNEINFEKQIFHKSEKLNDIFISDSIMEKDKALPKLLAMAVTALEAEYLLNPIQAGSDNWYQNLDSKILTVLNESEESALKNLVYCAEEDMGAKQETCLKKLAYKKSGIAFMRLIYSNKIAGVMKKKLTDFLLKRTKGCKDESAWEFVKESRCMGLQYCDKLFEINGINEENINEILDDLGEDNVELKAYLLKKWQGRGQDVDIWESLEFK
ncbi:MAG: leucine-rich repeat protein [Lachnospiraceae bacterium]|nr:leucine-rich repeat protein [Lachnospiraceae bacterium]